MVDIDELKQGIRRMTRRTTLYKVLKEELSVLGYWKNKARGNPIEAKIASDRAKASI